MNFRPYPMRFEPVLRRAIWGGNRIAQRYRRLSAPSNCAESWEISAHPDGAGRLTNGPLAGMTLEELTTRFGRAFLGTAAPDADRFPLLFKVLDARARLSLQVHPNERTARLTGGESKSEGWYFLDATPDARIQAGLHPGTQPETLRQALSRGTAANLVADHAARAGDFLFVPGGLVHAIGAGCLVYEVQQSANTTYRLFDWNRTDANGKPRELHIEDGLLAINWHSPPVTPRQLTPAAASTTTNRRWVAPENPVFRLEKLALSVPEPLASDGVSFRVLFVEAGAAILLSAGCHDETLHMGDSCLLPAALENAILQPAPGGASLLITTLS